MRNWRIYYLFLKQILYLVIKVNVFIAVFTFLSILLANLVNKPPKQETAELSVHLPLTVSTVPPPVVPVQTPIASSVPKPLNSQTSPPRPDWAIAKSLPNPSRQRGKDNLEITYNLKKPPSFRQSQDLQTIVNDIVQLTTVHNLPKEHLSITLIDANTGETAGYQQDIPRYPASVVKMFWMVILYSQIKSGIWTDEKDFAPYIAKMIQESDNEAASYILDQITGTHSEPVLSSQEFNIWKTQRQYVNRFFEKAGYKGINIAQKTFPVYYLNLPEPDGSEAQFLEDNPVRNWNKITTKQAARLLYEICYTKQAVSAKVSEKMCDWLKRDLNPEFWQNEPSYRDGFNPVSTFLGESLPHTQVKFYSKAGWASYARGEAAMVDNQKIGTKYILTILTQNSAYADDSDILPEISLLVYKRMTQRCSRSKSIKLVRKNYHLGVRVGCRVWNVGDNEELRISPLLYTLSPIPLPFSKAARSEDEKH
ncbi:MAG: serine hydrolase [Scytonema sp. PMC 1069.18]|nr:serine hydrolase [Scytonema sp. PMC 1069.18]MEC4888078.1 serine hydrolase [Scytonema sp. PMC 1070.18]